VGLRGRARKETFEAAGSTAGAAHDLSPTTSPTPDRLRSLLFAPAARPEMVSKLPATGADAVVIDYGDAKSHGVKIEGHENARRLAPQIAGQGAEIYVRADAVPSVCFAEDVRDGLCASLAGIVIPKLEAPDQLEIVGDALAHAGLPDLPRARGRSEPESPHFVVVIVGLIRL
jgi:hypothetical protein